MLEQLPITPSVPGTPASHITELEIILNAVIAQSNEMSLKIGRLSENIKRVSKNRVSDLLPSDVLDQARVFHDLMNSKDNSGASLQKTVLLSESIAMSIASIVIREDHDRVIEDEIEIRSE